MVYFNAQDIDTKLQKKLLIGGVIPRPVGLALTQSDEYGINLAPFSYFNIVAYDPGLLSISIQRHPDGRMKDTARNIVENKAANIHIVDKDLVEEANKTAAPLDPSQTELASTNFKLETHVNHPLPYINQAKLVYFTKLYEHHEIKRHDQSVVADLLILQVEGHFLKEAIFDSDNQYIEPYELDPVSRLAGNDYADLGKIKTIIRPE